MSDLLLGLILLLAGVTLHVGLVLSVPVERWIKRKLKLPVDSRTDDSPVPFDIH
jgi:hypothetical protein